MSDWHDDLRPGSFRGVPFKALGHRAQEARKGVHFTFADRNLGYVEDQGLEDGRFTLEVYVIDDEVAAARDALRSAMLQPGVGTLIHPWFGSMDVVPVPGSALGVREDSRQRRMAKMRLSFLRATDTPEFPSAGDRVAERIAREAIQLRQSVASSTASRVDLSGPAWVSEAGRVDTLREAEAFTSVEVLAGVGPVAGTGQVLVLSTGTGIGSVIDLADESSLLDDISLALDIADIALDVIADPEGALLEFGTAFIGSLSESVLGFDALAVAARLHLLGERTFALFDRGRRSLRSPAGVRLATARILARPVSIASSTDLETAAGRRVIGNRIALDRQSRIAAICYQGEALGVERFDGHDSALIALKAFDNAAETIIRAESEETDIRRGLTDLRAVTRETLLANAANVVPVRTLHPGVSLPSLALTWRTNGGIASAADIVARNRVVNPLFCPARDVLVRAEVT